MRRRRSLLIENGRVDVPAGSSRRALPRATDGYRPRRSAGDLRRGSPRQCPGQRAEQSEAGAGDVCFAARRLRIAGAKQWRAQGGHKAGNAWSRRLIVVAALEGESSKRGNTDWSSKRSGGRKGGAGR